MKTVIGLVLSACVFLGGCATHTFGTQDYGSVSTEQCRKHPNSAFCSQTEPPDGRTGG